MYDREMISRCVLSPFGSFYKEEQVRKELIDGYKYGVRSIVVEADQVPLLKEIEQAYGNGYTRTGMVLGYPYGGYTTPVKLKLAEYAIAHGIDEVDLGINIHAFWANDIDTMYNDLKAVIDYSDGRLRIAAIAWLIRNSLENIVRIMETFLKAGVKVIKTNPGGRFGEMKVEHVQYIHTHYPELEIEVAGRCRSRDIAEKMVNAGASYFHLSSWRRMSGIGDDIQFDFDEKRADYLEYRGGIWRK